ncbi:MAG: dicarboxylate transporter/tellurite-resistance protein TehA [Betaproteobacteria bacterium]
MSLKNISVPASYFGMILGLVGLGSDWRYANTLWILPAVVGEAIMLISGVLWLVLMLLYISKWLWHREDAIAELKHPIQCCFIGLVPVSTVLVSLALQPHARSVALVLFFVGAIGTLLFSVWRHGGLWRGGRDPASTTPVLYLPSVAGNFVVAIALGAFGWTEWGVLFFGAGLLAWLALESVILYRLFTAEPLAVPLRPTLGIQLAPPAVGLVAYLSVTNGDPGVVAQVLLGYALLQALILIRLLPWIRAQSFSAGYWAFTFGVSALALGAERMVDRGVIGPANEMAPILFIIANIVIGVVTLGSIILLAQGRLFPAAKGSASATSIPRA